MSYDAFELSQSMNEESRRSRLVAFDLSTHDYKTAERLQQKVIEPHRAEIVNLFYTKLTTDANALAILTQTGSLEKLHGTMTQYLITLGKSFDSETYFKQRIFVGVIHAQLGISLSAYISAYCILQQSLLSFVNDAWPDRHQLIMFIIKITGFDMSLAADAYHRSEVQQLESRLEKMKSRTKKLKTKLDIDALTQVLSRTSVEDVLDRALVKIRGGDGKACLIMGDIDRFKRVNDEFGHIVGDMVLKSVAKKIKNSLRDLDVVGRFGGEEFLMVLSDVDLDEARVIAERIRSQVAANVVKSDSAELSVTISLGLVALRGSENSQSAIERADSAMYKAKANGRNRIEIGE